MHIIFIVGATWIIPRSCASFASLDTPATHPFRIRATRAAVSADALLQICEACEQGPKRSEIEIQDGQAPTTFSDRQSSAAALERKLIKTGELRRSDTCACRAIKIFDVYQNTLGLGLWWRLFCTEPSKKGGFPAFQALAISLRLSRPRHEPCGGVVHVGVKFLEYQDHIGAIRVLCLRLSKAFGWWHVTCSTRSRS